MDPASPHRLEVSTVGDELRNIDPGSKVIGISLKARSAILPSGHRSNGAFWFDDTAGGFVSSTFYFDDLVERLRRPPDGTGCAGSAEIKALVEKQKTDAK